MKNLGHRSLTVIAKLKMSPRLDNTKWLWCLLALYSGSWNPVGSIAVKSPPNTPATVQAQAKFFQYRHLPTHEDYDQGHRLGSDRHFTERHERSRPGEGLFSAKVRWGDKQGGYGEHYWDLNHAGHADKHEDDGDDGSYNVQDNEDPYDEPSEQQSTYNDEYDPEQAAKYEESNRAKRHHKVKAEKKDDIEEVKTLRRRVKDENKKVNQESDDKHEEYQKYKPGKLHYKAKEINYDEDQLNPNSPVQHPEQPEKPHVPYESGAGVRQHQPAEVTAASAPRLFLDPSTGHVVDRATGQAYVLQPIVVNYQ